MRKFTSSMPPADSPVAIKFSPFEALLIGEKNKVVKRKPAKNTIFITSLRHTHKKQFDLRALFDVDDAPSGSSRQKRKITRGKQMQGCKKMKHKSKPNVYCCKIDNRRVMVKNRENVNMQRRMKKKNQANKVRFKPDFKFRETAEERIVLKMRKKRMRQSVLLGHQVQSVLLGRQVQSMPVMKKQRHCLRGKNGKFISKSQYGNLNNVTNNNSSGPGEDIPDRGNDASDEDTKSRRIIADTMKHLPKITVETNEVLSNNISSQYYKSVFSDEVEFPPLPADLRVTDFDADRNFLDILQESRKRDDVDAEDCADLERRRKGLKIYERKNKSNGMRESVFNASTKENHFVNNGAIRRRLIEPNGHAVKMSRRHSLNYVIDERPTKEDHLLSENKFRSLFCKTPCGSETFLGSYMKPVLLNSQFGRLPDIS